MKNTKFLVGLLASAVLLLTGCVNVSTANVDQGVNLAALKTMYVLQNPEDKRGVNQLIVDKLQTKGVKVSTGTAEPKTKVDALVTYKDVWIWDWSTYLVDLTILMKNPTTEQIIASGNSRHGSLTRLTPPEMVSEVVEKIYTSGNVAPIVASTAAPVANTNQDQSGSRVQQLQNIKKLLDQGLISKSEYETKKAEILKSM